MPIVPLVDAGAHAQQAASLLVEHERMSTPEVAQFRHVSRHIVVEIDARQRSSATS